jgi:8-oxo-dGTP pyrophosphatase MutT (NUDIX family)
MTKPIIESVAKALLINSKNEVLILTLGQHTERPEKSFKPDLPGGLVDPGENEHDAVVREVNEETGIMVDRDATEMVYSRTQFLDDVNKSVSKHLFICRVDSDVDVTLSWEHSAYEWIDLVDLRGTKLRSFYDEAIEYCFSHEIFSVSA